MREEKQERKERDVVISECVRCVEDSVCGTSAALQKGLRMLKELVV